MRPIPLSPRVSAIADSLFANRFITYPKVYAAARTVYSQFDRANISVLGSYLFTKFGRVSFQCTASRWA